MTSPANDDRADGAFTHATQKVGEAAASAGHAVSEAAHSAKEKAADAAAAIRDRASDAYDVARTRASSARETAATGFDSAPLVALAGGIALGAIIGALLPKTDSEARLLGPVAAKASDAAKAAFTAARSAGQDKLDELGINRETARAKVDQLVDSASQAAGSAGAAAKDAVRNRADA
ncbi:MAG TPA: hypothetical protein VF649_05970 [Sphingomonas sp.]|jgi:ElaB/YqjD/DUF883 family membrane-anchored ribosome-binding protein|uniref:hypothetical protein n=1 Tax=Sphingomonas sp. TaxID=28214 RepID=UPI002ED7AD21